MIRDYRKRYPINLVFLQAECDLAARAATSMRAMADHRRDRQDFHASTMGPLLRARLYAAAGKDDTRWPGRTARHWQRNPRQPDVRVLLAQELIKLGELTGRVEAGQDGARHRTRIAPTPCCSRPAPCARSGVDRLAEGSRPADGRRRARGRRSRSSRNYRDAYHALAEIELERGRTPGRDPGSRARP